MLWDEGNIAWQLIGSCRCLRRFGQEVSLAVLTIDGENYQVQKMFLPNHRIALNWTL